MRHVDRGTQPAPAALTKQDGNGKTELERARAHINNPANRKSFEFAAYKEEEVKDRLHALFHGKCAYCETYFSASAPVDIEHYRPKNAVSEDETHPGYWWLAMEWGNLLPSCIDCNRKRYQQVIEVSSSLTALSAKSLKPKQLQSGKKDSFPVKKGTSRLVPEQAVPGTEAPLLLNPCVDNPDQYLHFAAAGKPSCSLVIPYGHSTDHEERGAVYIQVYGLNRLGLVQDRTRVLRHLEFLGNLVVELSDIIDDLEKFDFTSQPSLDKLKTLPGRLHLLRDEALKQMKDMTDANKPYSIMARTWVDAFIAGLAV